MNRIIEKECGGFVGIRKFEQLKKSNHNEEVSLKGQNKKIELIYRLLCLNIFIENKYNVRVAQVPFGLFTLQLLLTVASGRLPVACSAIPLLN
jgi:hypothetical protein